MCNKVKLCLIRRNAVGYKLVIKNTVTGEYFSPYAYTKINTGQVPVLSYNYIHRESAAYYDALAAGKMFSYKKLSDAIYFKNVRSKCGCYEEHKLNIAAAELKYVILKIQYSGKMWKDKESHFENDKLIHELVYAGKFIKSMEEITS